MRIKVKRNPRTCIELSDFIGYPVKEWTLYPDGSMEVDLDVESLTPGQKLVVINKLKEALTHLVEEE